VLSTLPAFDPAFDRLPRIAISISYDDEQSKRSTILLGTANNYK